MNEIVFWIIPDTADQTCRRYVIYYRGERKPIAYAEFEDGEYRLKGDPKLTYTAKLKILEECEWRRRQLFPSRFSKKRLSDLLNYPPVKKIELDSITSEYLSESVN